MVRVVQKGSYRQYNKDLELFIIGNKERTGGIELLQEQVEKVGKVEVFQNWARSFFLPLIFFSKAAGGTFPKTPLIPLLPLGQYELASRVPLLATY